MIDVIETENENPVCPHCEKAIVRIFAKKIKASFGVRFIYFCSNCKKVLGVSQRKGFWMG
jgi:uncharacterized protein with PIN domain